MDELQGIGPSAIALGVVAVAAGVLTARRRFEEAWRRPTAECVVIGLAAVAVHCAHFLEEFLFDFRTQFPELFGLSPISDRLFVTFNVFWICLWSVSLIGLHYRLRAALFPIWFLAIASAANALAHVGLSFVARGYFPGLFTVPLVGIAGILLLRELSRITRSISAAPDRLDERYWNA